MFLNTQGFSYFYLMVYTNILNIPYLPQTIFFLLVAIDFILFLISQLILNLEGSRKMVWMLRMAGRSGTFGKRREKILNLKWSVEFYFIYLWVGAVAFKKLDILR